MERLTTVVKRACRNPYNIYLARTVRDATTSTMRGGIEDHCNVRQKPDENEDRYRKRFKDAILRFGPVHIEDEKISLYNDGLSPKTSTVVAHHRNSVHRLDLIF